MKIEKNAKRSDDVTDEQWQEVNQFNRDMVEDYLSNQTHLSDKSLISYSSALRIYFIWVKDHLNNKSCIEIKKKEFLRYMNWLSGRGLSESAIKMKKSSVSAFNKFIENFYEDEYPFRNYVTSEMKVPITGKVHEKIPLTQEEIDFLCDELAKRNEWEKLAYIKFTYSTGCRRAESRQLLKEVVDYQPHINMITIIDDDGKEQEVESVSYKTHDIRCKGRSKLGKVRKLQFGQDVMDALNKWLEERGDDDNPYMFVIKVKKTGEIRQIADETFNGWCSGLFTEIMNRRIFPHLFRSSRATNLVVGQHRPIETAQKLLGHASSETTQIYVVREDTDDADDAFV